MFRIGPFPGGEVSIDLFLMSQIEGQGPVNPFQSQGWKTLCHAFRR